MLNFNSIMIGTSDPKRLIEFYEKVFDKKPDMSDESYAGWQVGGSWFNLGEHSEVKGDSKEPQRIILNFETSQVKEEFERIKSAGAEVIKEPYELEGMSIATLADPDGNYFQLMSPWQDTKNSNGKA
jgi:predicted enzyme related to lactoylglutathione lyase